MWRSGVDINAGDAGDDDDDDWETDANFEVRARGTLVVARFALAGGKRLVAESERGQQQ